MSDKKYLGLGIIFKAIDKGFSKVAKNIQNSLINTANQIESVQSSADNFGSEKVIKQLRNVQASIDGLDFDRMNELVTTYKVFEDSIGGTDPFGKLQSGLYEIEDQMINLTLAASQVAKKKSLENYLETLRDSGRLTSDQFKALDKALGDISDLNFPKPNIDTLKEMNEFIQEQRNFVPRLSNGLDGWSKSLIGLEISIDKVNKQFEAEQKIKSINKYRLEMQNLHNQAKISDKDFAMIMDDLNKLSDTFIKKAKSPQSFFDKILIGAKVISKPLREIGSSVFDLGKTIIANLPSVAEGLVGKGEVSKLGADLDFLKTKMSLVMNPKQSEEFNNSLIKVMQTTGMTADQAGTLANTMNRFGVSVKDSTELMPFLGNLVGKMGLDGEQVAEMGGQLTRTLGMSVDEAKGLTSEFYEMGKARGFVDFLEDMPAIVKETTSSFKRLGIVNSDVASKSVKSTAALTGMYRSMNIEQKTAVAAAVKMQKSLTTMSMDIKRIGVGLEPENFDAMIDVAGEITRLSGKSADEAFKMMQDGATDTEGYMKNLMKIADLPSTTEQDLVRLSEIVRTNYGDEAADILMNADLRKKAQDESYKAAQEDLKNKKDGQEALTDDQKILQGTFKVSQDLLKTNQELTKAMGEMAGKGAILASWNTQLGVWQEKQEAINKGALEGKALIAAYVQEAAGLSGVAFLAGMDKTGAALGTIGANAQVATDAMRSLSGLIAGMQGFGSILSSLFLGLIPTLAKFFGSFLPVGGIVEGIKTFGKGLSKLGIVGKIFGRILGPIGAAIGFIGDGIDAIQEKTAGKGIATALFGKSVKPDDMIKDAGSQALKWGALGATIGSFIFPGVGTAIGAAIGGAVGVVGSFFKNAIANDWFSGMGDKISSIWDSVISYVKEKWNNLWAGISDVGSYIKASFKNVFNNIGDVGSKIADSLISSISWVGKQFPSLFNIGGYIVDAVKNAFITAFNFVKSLWDKLPFSGITKFFTSETTTAPQANTVKQQAAMQAIAQPNIVTAPAVSMPLAQPNRNQTGAPPASKLPVNTPTTSKDTGNTLDDVVKTLNDVKDSFVSEIRNITNRPVNVALLGDAKKFFKAANAEAMGNVGPYANQVGG